MSYRNHKISIENINVTEFIRSLAAGKYLIPSFQRAFVWNPEHIIALWDSIYHGYPIGSILYWKTRIRLNIHRKIGGFFIPPSSNNGQLMHSYILDGQQRATSLLVSFAGGKNKVSDDRDFDYTLYFDLVKAEFFFENQRYRHIWETDAAFLMRLKDVPDLPDDFVMKLVKVSGYSDQIKQNLEQLKYMFTNYTIPLVSLAGFTLEGVCDVFERMNQTGVKLDNMDIIIARNFKDYPLVIAEDWDP